MKKWMSLILALALCALISAPALALEAQPAPEDASASVTRTDPYSVWRVYTHRQTGVTNDPWRAGPSKVGPGPLTMTIGSEKTVHSTITGSYQDKHGIEIALGVDFSEARYMEAECSYDVPANHKWTILYAPRFAVIEVVEREYMHLDGDELPTGNKTISTAYVFEGWDFDKRVDY